MNWLVYHVVSGQSFFTGVGLIVLSVLLASRAKPIAKRLSSLAFLLGIVAIVVSSTPLPYWYYVVAGTTTVAWMVPAYKKRWPRASRIAVVVVWLIAAVIEIPYHVAPSLAPENSRTITVIGDSITAGLGEDETWPKMLARDHNLDVCDISYPADTTASALKRAKRQTIDSPIVIIEIGGNDLLGSTSSAQFHDDLDALLAYATRADRQVVMFELPLPPLHHEFGRAQRRLARKYDVLLIPKRVLLGILASDAATLDSIHLSESGHQRMADRVWQLVGSAYKNVIE